MIYDYCIIGGGIVGLACAWQLLEKRPGASVILLEKESSLARHQTGHNSGVIHAGVYYAPGSLKAQLCKEGAAATKAFCQEQGIAYQQCGKLLVASNALELSRMGALQVRALENGLTIQSISAEELAEREPAIRGLGALWVPDTGIVDYVALCQAMAKQLQTKGVLIQLNSEVTQIQETSEQVNIVTAAQTVQCRQLICCAGLQSDRLAMLAGLKVEHRIIPFRGEYFVLPEKYNQLISHLIYPIPDPNLPFLGIHLTRMINGRITVGPNAVLGFSREGYAKGSVKLKDLQNMMAFAGLWKVLAANWRSGLTEFRHSLFKSGYLAQCRKYCPQLSLEDLQPYPAGIRAQAVMKDGSLVQDFLFLNSARMLHVCNAPSPAATSALPIAKRIVERVLLV